MDPLAAIVPILPCLDLDAAEAWWRRLGFAGETPPVDDYRMLADADGGEIHLARAAPGWLAADRNPCGVYIRTPRVDAHAALLRDAIIEPERRATHKPWGMYEFAVDGPDGLLVRIGWPSRPIAAG